MPEVWGCCLWEMHNTGAECLRSVLEQRVAKIITKSMHSNNG